MKALQRVSMLIAAGVLAAGPVFAQGGTSSGTSTLPGIERPGGTLPGTTRMPGQPGSPSDQPAASPSTLPPPPPSGVDPRIGVPTPGPRTTDPRTGLPLPPGKTLDPDTGQVITAPPR